MHGRTWEFLLLASALLLACGALVSGETFTFDDDFSKYPAGSDGSPAWASGGIAWEVRGGAFTSSDRGKDTALVAAAPIGAAVVVQAQLKLRESVAKGWKVAGLCIQKDPSNYWHLALVEGPDEQGKRRFVELSEMLGGTWLAHTQAATKLAAKETKGTGFNWEYEHPYKLTLELNAGGITGQVLEADGTVRAKISYAFDKASAVTCGRPGVTAGGFRAEFSAFSTKVDQPMPDEKKDTQWPPYDGRGYTAIKGKATGFFHVEQIGERWWTIDPAGNAFFIIGTDHANYNCHWCEKLGYAPYHRNCEKRYGSEEKWADSTLARLKAWGFNALGVNASPSLCRRGLPHPEFLSLGTGFTAHDYITERTTWTGFPNVFSPKWQVYCEKQARHRCAPLKDDPWVLGYFIDNELEWHQWTGKGLFGDTFAKPSDHSAKRALVELLKQRHGTAESFNKAWGTAIASFDELLALTAAPAPKNDAAKADVTEYTRLVAEKYFSIASAAIRKADPNHMVLGCRFAGYAPEIVDTAGKYCDIFSINCYRNVDLERGVMTDGFEEDLKRWHEQSKRPMMITEWSFPALDAGLPCKHGAGQRVPTQADKAFCFTVFQKLLFSTPYMVGSNYFMWADEPALGISSTFPEDSNYGLVNENDDVYEVLTQAATKLHQYVYDIHSGKVTDVYVKAAKNGFTVGNAGTVAAKAKVTLWVDGQPQSRDVELAAGASQDVAPPADVAAKPGGHLLVCQVETDNPLLERNAADNSAVQSQYVPGAGWADAAQGATQRVPLLIANPSDKPLGRAVAAVKVADLLPGQPLPEPLVLAVLDTETGKRPPVFQLERLEDGAQLVVSVSDLGPRCARAFCVYAGVSLPDGVQGVTYRKTDSGFEADNGVLKLVKDNPKSGNAFDRISLRGLELGSFTPLVHQSTGQNQWVRPDKVEKVDVFNGPVRLVLEMTFAREKSGANDRRYRTKYRFVIEPNREWFTSQLLWIENADASAWELIGYYHYLPSNIGGDAKDDEARGNYWFDAKTKTCFGIVPGAPQITVNFWKDPGGGEHPDAARKLNITLQPGERYAKTEPVAYIVAAEEGAWKEAEKRVRSQRGIVWQAFGAEKR